MREFLFYTSIFIFYWKNKYSKVLNGDVYWKSTGRICGMSQGSNDGTFCDHPRDVGRTRFANSFQKHIKLTLTGYSRLYSEL